jgi:cell division protein FtsQ
VVLVLMLLGGGWLWVRGSSLVSVDRVTVTGLRGPSSRPIRAALLSAARDMTTLDVNMSALRVAVAPFPAVKSLDVSTQFPHGMRIRVLELVPVGVLAVGDRKIPVGANGTLLPSDSGAGLASIPVSAPPGGPRVTAGATRNAVAVLAAAPLWLRARVAQVSTTTANGLVAEMHDGPQIYFGDAGELRAKWMAVAAVLADPGSEGAAYIDVTVPERPAVAGVAGASSSGQTSADAAPADPTGATGSGDAPGDAATSGG